MKPESKSNAVLDQLPEGSRVAVIRLRSLGDCVLTTPALALLEAYRPDLEVAVVVEDRFREIFRRTLPPEPGAIFGFRPRLTLNLHGGTRSMQLTLASAARVRAGFAHHSLSFLYNARIPRAQEVLGEERPVHTAEHLASAMFWLGVPQGEIPRARLAADPPATRPPKPYAVLHPFASHPDKAWPVSRFVQVSDTLRARLGLETVVVAGPTDNIAPFEGLPVLRDAPLSKVKSLMSRASLFIGNDSGPAHIAAAFGVPVVVLFGPSNPVTWAPWRTESQVLTSNGPIVQISVEQVLAAAETLKVRA